MAQSKVSTIGREVRRSANHAASRRTGRRAIRARRQREVTQQTRASHVLAELRRRIMRQVLPPGSKLREQELAAEFEVPRSRIREAFSVLEQRGLIERIPNRGAVVKRLDLSQVFEIYAVREVLEGLCVRLATENTPPESWQDLVDLFGRPMEQFVAGGDYDAFLAGYDRFRRRVLEAANNQVLADMLDSIHERTQAIIRRIIILPGRAEQGLKEHQAVLAAMRRGDAEEAERLRRLNMTSAREWLKKFQAYVL